MASLKRTPVPSPGTEWVPYPAAPGYEVSRTGLVRVVGGRHAGRILTRRVQEGYVSVRLCFGSRKSKRLVALHRIVLETFVGPPLFEQQCRHLDGDPSNNRIENLCWGTVAENAADKMRHGRSGGEHHPKAKLTWEKVDQIRAEYYAGGVTQAELARRYGVTSTPIEQLLSGKTWRRTARPSKGTR